MRCASCLELYESIREWTIRTGIASVTAVLSDRASLQSLRRRCSTHVWLRCDSVVSLLSAQPLLPPFSLDFRRLCPPYFSPSSSVARFACLWLQNASAQSLPSRRVGCCVCRAPLCVLVLHCARVSLGSSRSRLCPRAKSTEGRNSGAHRNSGAQEATTTGETALTRARSMGWDGCGNCSPDSLSTLLPSTGSHSGIRH